jgi:hypothetical protein
MFILRLQKEICKSVKPSPIFLKKVGKNGTMHVLNIV